ncbi:MAG: hypothetical protein ACXWUG_03955 [Polyangiales bacterium]
MRLADEARALARIVLDAGGEIDAVLGEESIAQAAEERGVDPHELRAAIEAEILRRGA